MSQKARLMVVDDHPIVRQGLAQLINHEHDLEVCCEAENVRDAMEAVTDQALDMAIVDVSLDGVSGIELIKIVKDRVPDLPILVLSMHDESLFAERALRAGAKGYIMKQEAPDRLIAAIRRVLSGGMYLSDAMSERLLRKLVSGDDEEAASPIERLSDRELEIFQLIGHGHSTRVIADKLDLSVKTVDSHRAHIKEKLRMRSSTELVHYAISWVQGQAT